MTETTTLGQQLRAARKLAGLTQETAATLLHLLIAREQREEEAV